MPFRGPLATAATGSEGSQETARQSVGLSLSQYISIDCPRAKDVISKMDYRAFFSLSARSPEGARIVPIGKYVESTAVGVTRGDPVAIQYEAGEEGPLVGKALHLEWPFRRAKECNCVATGRIAGCQASPAGKPQSEIVLKVIVWLEPNQPPEFDGDVPLVSF